jgi:hypothetical protein
VLLELSFLRVFNNIVGQTHIKKPTSTQATAPEKSTPVEQDNNKTPNEN